MQLSFSVVILLMCCNWRCFGKIAKTENMKEYAVIDGRRVPCPQGYGRDHLGGCVFIFHFKKNAHKSKRNLDVKDRRFRMQESIEKDKHQEFEQHENHLYDEIQRPAPKIEKCPFGYTLNRKGDCFKKSNFAQMNVLDTPKLTCPEGFLEDINGECISFSWFGV